MENPKKRLDKIENAMQEQGLEGVLLIATPEGWAAMAEAEKDKLRKVAKFEGLPILIMDR